MKYLFPFLLILFSGGLAAQDNTDHWNTLAMVTLDSKYDDLMGMVVQKATPLPVVEPLNGKEIHIRGYIIALSAKSSLKHFMFSRYPQNMCFFCGAAGPESAMQVFLKKGDSINYSTDKVELKGTLNIQKGDPSGLIYTLQNAELIRIIK
ncbi:MAG: DUF3299 domain-containing protein [Saprospiraceae bacterium]|nr:DUF3299 domain-containing protein [Bacteroidia bacterium]NNF21830.1 DUF3299 domain-containing protein [Saprospiraceae bacterium]